MLSGSVTMGAPGFIASSGSYTPGMGSSSNSTSSMAWSAMSRVSAAMRARGSPKYRTRSLTSTCWPVSRRFWPTLARNVGRRGAVGEVGGGEDARHAFQGTRPGDVEAHQPGARDIGAHDSHVEHAGHHVVAGIGGTAGDLAGRVGAGQGPPDLPEPDVGPRLDLARDTGHRPALPGCMPTAAASTDRDAGSCRPQRPEVPLEPVIALLSPRA